MYAIIEAGGRQWKVEPGTRLDINRLAAAVGSAHTVEQVLLTHDGQQASLGQPYVQGAKVVCEILEHRLGPKALTYKFRRRENWRKTIGHRQPLSRVLVKEIILPGGTKKAAETITKTPRVTRKPPKLSVTKSSKSE